MIRYCRQEALDLTRGRPNTSNDSCHVEQKNWSVVRQTIGYARFEGQPAVAILNEIYNNLRLFNNFFYTVCQTCFEDARRLQDLKGARQTILDALPSPDGQR